MTTFSKLYCLVSIAISIDFIVSISLELSGLNLDAWTSISGLVYIIWVPMSIIGCAIFFFQDRFAFSISTLSYVIYVALNYFLTPKYQSKIELDIATICGIAFFYSLRDS